MKKVTPHLFVFVTNAIKQQVVPPQNESSSNCFVNNLVTSLRESHSSDDFNGTEIIHVKPKKRRGSFHHKYHISQTAVCLILKGEVYPT